MIKEVDTNKEGLSGLAITCKGVGPRDVMLDPNTPTVDVSLTIYKSGRRNVGCPHISGIYCEKIEIVERNSTNYCAHHFR